MREALKIAARFAVLGLVFMAVAALSNRPLHRSLPEDAGVLMLSFSHGADRKAACRKATPEELAKLPPNMRFPEQCPRERAPLTMRVELDGKSVLDRVVPPTGLSKDGASSIYERLAVPAGNHHLEVSLNDDVRPGAQTYTRSADVTLAPGQVLVVDFDANQGAIVLQ